MPSQLRIVSHYHHYHYHQVLQLQELTCWLMRIIAMSFRRVNSEKVSSMVARGVSRIHMRMSHEQLSLSSHGELTGIDYKKVTFLLLVDVANTGKQETSDRILYEPGKSWYPRIAWMIVYLVTNNSKKVAVLVGRSRHWSEKKQQLALGGVSSFFRIFLFRMSSSNKSAAHYDSIYYDTDDEDNTSKRTCDIQHNNPLTLAMSLIGPLQTIRSQQTTSCFTIQVWTIRTRLGSWIRSKVSLSCIWQ